jgi:hypothetical protein
MSLHLPHRRALMAATALPPFSLDAFMASQSAGFWYDFTRSDTMFQEDVGPTPADEPNEVIGLALSQRLWGGQTRTGYLAGQPNLTPAGSWLPGTTGGGATATESPAGTLNLVTDGSSSAFADQVISTVAGRVYELRATVAGNIATAIAGATQGSAAFLNTGMAGGGQTTALYFVASGATSWVRFNRGAPGSCTISAVSVREVSQVPATQSTTSFKPKFQTTGAAFDGTDDNLLTNYTAGSGANFLIAKVVVPASIPSNQFVAGAFQVGENSFGIGFGANGQLRFRAGAVSIQAGGDYRGSTRVVAVTNDGTNIRAFVDDEQIYEGAQTGTPASPMPLRIGATNVDGVAFTFFGGSTQHVLAGREFIDLARFNQIANALGA